MWLRAACVLETPVFLNRVALPLIIYPQLVYIRNSVYIGYIFALLSVLMGQLSPRTKVDSRIY